MTKVTQGDQDLSIITTVFSYLNKDCKSFMNRRLVVYIPTLDKVKPYWTNPCKQLLIPT